MAHRYLISQDSPALYITLVAKDRLPVFQKDQMKEVLCRAIDEARTRFLLFAYVIMIDHLHLLTSKPTTTSEVLRVLKGLTARRVVFFGKAATSRARPKLQVLYGSERRTCFRFLARRCLWRN
jgi:REP element-mobilizing transposase RayT